ncbi:MAG: hypothetical protein SD837_15485 [Candidatus Electrothrix scaldis]|nr:MAG: hypothetical protein SD837_15485 [Candidatus Electrothrix sp. GW3-3]
MKAPNPNSPAFKTIVRGRIRGHEHVQGKKKDSKGFYKTTVIHPAQDEYSHPSTFAVNASAPLGPDNQDVAVICNLRPYNRNGFNNLQLWLDEEPGDTEN